MDEIKRLIELREWIRAQQAIHRMMAELKDLDLLAWTKQAEAEQAKRRVA